MSTFSSLNKSKLDPEPEDPAFFESAEALT